LHYALNDRPDASFFAANNDKNIYGRLRKPFTQKDDTFILILYDISDLRHIMRRAAKLGIALKGASL